MNPPIIMRNSSTLCIQKYAISRPREMCYCVATSTPDCIDPQGTIMCLETPLCTLYQPLTKINNPDNINK
uniref:Uncharacterized protein n=1 Tax=Anguilla anguilla TaxID=7936 RepID=A0A0E9VJS4_ANGAN